MRLWLVLLVVALLMMPSAASAQSIPDDYLISSDRLGEGWTARDPIEPIFMPLAEKVAQTYVGPEGANITIEVFALGETMSLSSGNWTSLVRMWDTRVKTLGGMDDPLVDPRVATSDFERAEPISEAMVAEGRNRWTNEIVGVGLYAYQNAIGIVVTIEGAVSGYTGAAAVNYVLSLVVAE